MTGPSPLRFATGLRANALLMVLAMLVLPQLIVVGWSLMERDIGGRMQADTQGSVEEASRVLRAADEDPRTAEGALSEVAARWGTRIRLVRVDGTIVLDADADRGTDFIHQVGTLFFGPDGAPSLREFDETLGPVPRRPEVGAVTGWPGPPAAAPPPLPEGLPHVYPFVPVPTSAAGAAAPVGHAFRHGEPLRGPEPAGSGCRTSPAAKLLVCHAAAAVSVGGAPHVLYAQESSRRAVRVLYDLRYHLARLSIVMLPFALLFSWWMGHRMVRPITWLRTRILEKARSANPRADIDLRGAGEVRDLAVAFNDLLGALDERRRANEAFVADLVHEFKNPVAAIRAAAESLASGAADEKRAARLARILEDSSGRLDRLVSQFLELARAEAGMPREDRDPVDLDALARGVVAATEPSSPETRFVVERIGGGGAVVRGVPARLDSLVRNLVDNAASFAGSGGEVRVVIDGEPDAVRIAVSDTGPGIAEADLSRVFDRFFTTRAKDGARREPRAVRGGSGLGLALVKAIAEAHGGDVSVSSSPGNGATFAVRLPRSGE